MRVRYCRSPSHPAQNRRLPLSTHAAAAADLRRKFVSGQFDEEKPFVLISSALLVQPDDGVSVLVVDRIGDYLPQSTEKSRVLVIPIGARNKCQQVQPDEGVSVLVVDRIGDYLPQSTEKSRVLVIPVGARHKCQQAQNRRLPLSTHAAAAADLRRKFVSGQFDEEKPFVLISSALLVQPDDGVSVLVVDRIGDYLPQSTEKSRVLVIPIGARNKCQQGIRF
ncbi:hypothetical protein F511_26679 [Dorcoceras hygrometricum]|uniref:Uncharacterized protein n=1 Tax=Dorcoceras hygrometricum TaxID=472368 RepID=A0A2Z7D5R8_9LAMI|nr:hypothetical protein F511_26679 [Dorcoceras hygrometricum]